MSGCVVGCGLLCATPFEKTEPGGLREKSRSWFVRTGPDREVAALNVRDSKLPTPPKSHGGPHPGATHRRGMIRARDHPISSFQSPTALLRPSSGEMRAEKSPAGMDPTGYAGCFKGQ